MEALSIEKYVLLGNDIRLMLGVQEGVHLYAPKTLEYCMKRFVESCKAQRLHVTLRVFERQFEAILNLWQEHHANLEGDEKVACKLSADEAILIRQAAHIVQSTLVAEAQGIYAYVTKDKRFNVDKLLNDVESIMAPGVFDKLPEVAKYDLGEAGRCIAFETPTAAAFHLMRGTEDTLRWFYCSIVKRGRLDQKQMVWGAIVNHLRKRHDAPPAILLNNLDNLRTGFRNPTQHPDKIYDIEEVQDLFALSLDVINRMVKYIHPEIPHTRKPAD
ncbi:hypothetical protein [Micromonospora sp. WMMD736]|uniref:hypothetical protein n=1 Tax=Micromonospora sp. WMMD736 TaxID=3404112 RepID=UPI003B963EAA